MPCTHTLTQEQVERTLEQWRRDFREKRATWREKLCGKKKDSKKKKGKKDKAPYPGGFPAAALVYGEKQKPIERPQPQPCLRGMLWALFILVFLLGAGMAELSLLLNNPEATKMVTKVWKRQFNNSFPPELMEKVREGNFTQVSMKIFSAGLLRLGAFIALTGFGGMLMLAIHVRYCNWLYALYLALVLTALGCSIAYRGFILNEAKPWFNATLRGYEGWDSTRAQSIFWNMMHIVFECCGVEGYQDFELLQSWPKNKANPGNLITPLSCCKNITPSNISCAQEGKATNSSNWLDKGCLEEVKEFLDDSRVVLYMYKVFFTLFGLLLFGTIFIRERVKNRKIRRVQADDDDEDDEDDSDDDDDDDKKKKDGKK